MFFLTLGTVTAPCSRKSAGAPASDDAIKAPSYIVNFISCGAYFSIEVGSHAEAAAWVRANFPGRVVMWGVGETIWDPRPGLSSQFLGVETRDDGIYRIGWTERDVYDSRESQKYRQGRGREKRINAIV